MPDKTTSVSQTALMPSTQKPNSGGTANTVHVQFLLEGEEEIGSPSLSNFLASHKEMLAADYGLSADGGQVG